MLNTSPKLLVIDLGLCDYHRSWTYQASLQHQLIQKKRAGIIPSHHFLVLCEHPPVYTLGKSGSTDNLLIKPGHLDKIGAKFVPINRGGDITFHGPGQLVVYPILDLDQFFTDVHVLIRKLETTVINTLAEFNIRTRALPQYTGVWIDRVGSNDRKICAIGIHLSRWVTMHGLALNVNTDLTFFDHIVPCGISDDNKSVTSMQRELGAAVEMQAVKDRVVHHFAREFECVTL